MNYDILFNNWEIVFRTVVIGLLAYVGLIFLLRISGKRTLSKFNAFDFIVTVALGSTLATVLLNKDVALAEGMSAFATLIFMQFAITWLSSRSGAVRNIVKSDPSLLFYRGNFLDKPMSTERITREEILAAIRQAGVGSLEEVDAIVLETDGSISVLQKVKDKESGVMSTVLNKITNIPN